MQGGSLYFANQIFRVFAGDCTVGQVNNTEYFTMDYQNVAKVWYKPSWWPESSPQGPTVVVVYVGGMGSHFECNLATMRYISKCYFDGIHTMALYTFDGQSFLSIDQYVESLKKLYDEIVTKYPTSLIIGMGHSLGTGLLCKLATERPLDGLVLYNPFQRPIDILANRDQYTMIQNWTMKLVSWFMGGALDSDANIRKVLRRPSNNTKPFLLFVYVSNQDQVIPNRFGRALAKTAQERPDMKVSLFDHDGNHSEILHEHIQRQIHEILNNELLV